MNDFRIATAGLRIIQVSEGLALKTYLCPAQVWTIGYGHTKGVKAGDTCTKEQAEAWLLEDCEDAERAVQRLVTVPINQNQFDALVSFTFNLGSGNLTASTLLRKLNSGDYVGAALEFSKWVKGGGRVLPGLVTRRKAEQNLFSKPI